MTMFKQQLTQNIINEINIYQHHLEIAKKIDLDNPILQSMQEGQSVFNEPDALFYKGTKVLSQQLIYLTKLLNDSNDLTLDYNLILEQASLPILVSKTIYFFMGITLAFGLFLSFIFVFLRSLFQKI